MNNFKQNHPMLCSPLHIGRITLRNRMCSSPMGFPDLTEDGCLTEGAIAFYEERAKGGAAIVTISEAMVDHTYGKSHGRLIDLENPGALAGLTNAARAIKRHGALASIELNHAGMNSEFDVIASERKGDGVHYGPSDCVMESGTVVKAMDEAMIKRIVDLYAKGAAVVKRAGFDMLMLHAGHGWLIHQFLSPVTNKRTDNYGGSLENRARLAIEIIDAIRAAVGRDFPIEIRFSGMELAEGGIRIEDAVEFAKLIESRVDILHVSAGSEPDFLVTHPSMFAEPGCNVKYAAEIKKHVSIPVATVGALNEPDHMEEIISSGKADIVCMARALLADPFLPKKVEANRDSEILRCMRCFVCHAERMLTQTRVCAINPVIGREKEARFIPKAAVSKKVLVAGGGPGGLQAALTAAERGHTVTLCEKTGSLGGMLNCEKNVPFKSSFKKYTDVMTNRLILAGVEIRLDTEVTPEFVERFAPDALIIAIGAGPMTPPISGVDGKNVFYVTELEDTEHELGKKIVMIGGGLSGCECGVHLGMTGHDVTIVEMADIVAKDANPRHRPALMEMLAKHTTVKTGFAVAEITPEGVGIKNAAGETEFIAADSVIIAAGMKPDPAAVDALRGLVPVTEVVGDCDRPSNIRNATFRGYHAALDI
ncbi:MAG: FAD-dependent oxidoreductase [Lachnospiraceae bacterium]|nr:FAD-dependent oxidoreductase [Lachnospiraceae bacterium]